MLKRRLKLSVSAIASASVSAFAQTCGRVVTARYSRRICRLIAIGPLEASRARAARAWVWNGAPAAVE
jgi:hypothetical protein